MAESEQVPVRGPGLVARVSRWVVDRRQTAPGRRSVATCTRAGEALERLGTGRTISDRLQTAVTSCYYGGFSMAALKLAIMAFVGLFLAMPVLTLARKAVHLGESLGLPPGTAAGIALTVATMMFGFLTGPAAKVAAAVSNYQAASPLPGQSPVWEGAANRYRFGFAVMLLRGIDECADVQEAVSPTELAWAMVDLATTLHSVETQAKDAGTRRGTIAFLGGRSRRRAARRHGRTVAAAVRRATAELDTDPRAAAPRIAAMLHTIAEQYVEGCITALLPQDELEGLHPARSWEGVKIAAWAVSAPALTWGTELLRLEGAMQTSIIAGGMVAVGACLYGGRVLAKAAEVLPLIGGR
ncbi:hypothetical protein ACFYUY_31180 [Kitasatospora sp. NPDC004745]|uniref:hypothetical protein n=1 Tax=Kitasatospora sp. NPDC004745 TaxID=3364019 RepID=UPI0036B081AD